ncbi:MAG: TRAP transporter small permease [Saprospiraceae bacterium]|nr:TRAP transporter small permease [Saprospiraceae bacterium]
MRLTLDTWLGHLVVSILAAMTLNVIWQVASRYLLKMPSSFTDELARYLLIWLGLFGAAYASGQGHHLSIDLLVNRLSPRQKRRVNVVIYCCVILFAASVMVVGGLRLVYLTFALNQTSAALDLPLGVVYAALPASGLLVVAYKVMDILDDPDPKRRRMFVKG